MQLTDPHEYEGGELELHDGVFKYLPKNQGAVIAFPSYVLHKVNPVTRGVRHSLVTWVTGPQFK